MVKRGEVWLAAIDPTVGSEIRKSRPCRIISPPEMHDHLRTVIVAPMTSASRPAGFRVPVEFQGVAGLILLEQARAIEKQGLIRRLGAVGNSVLKQTLKTLRDVYEEQAGLRREADKDFKCIRLVNLATSRKNDAPARALDRSSAHPPP